MTCKSKNLWPCGQCAYLQAYEPERENFMCKGKECPAYIQPPDEIVFVTPFIIEMILRWRKELNK